MDREQLDREAIRLGADPALRLLCDQVDGQIIAEWLATGPDDATRREQLWHELTGAQRLRVRLKVAQDDETIAVARAAARDDEEQEEPAA